jgi:hypothetical protein
MKRDTFTIARDDVREIRWLAVLGFPGYEVSDRGDVRSELAAGFGRKPEQPRILKATFDGHGYRRVYLRRNGRTHSRKVSWLVLEAFVGPRPEKSDACHNDGNRENDALANLRWDSRRANLADCVKHGTRRRGSAVGTAALFESDVKAIRRALAVGRPQSAIAAEFGVSQTTVSKINLGKRWGWLQ